MIGQGNGLFGSSEACVGSGGFFAIHSGTGTLWKSPNVLRLKFEKIPFSGTLIDGCMSYAVPGSLAKALGLSVSGSDYLSSRYEMDDERPSFLVRDEVASAGARFAAKPLRIHVLNLLTIADVKGVILDFSGLPLISSSFADELVGKLAAEIGMAAFNSAISVANANSTVVGLINRAIRQRLAND